MKNIYEQLENITDPTIKTKFTHPYSYDPIVVFKKEGEATGSCYSDRLYQQDPTKFDELSKKHFGNESQHWNNRPVSQIECFLKDFIGRKVEIIEIQEQCNQSSGYPLWFFAYKNKI